MRGQALSWKRLYLYLLIGGVARKAWGLES